MAAKILQLVNSAFFGLARRIESIEQAVTLLGTDVIKSLVLSKCAFSQFEPRESVLSLDELGHHSSLTGSLAASIARSEHADKAAVGEALLAGMLHDIGQLILAVHAPEQLNAAMEIAARRNVALHEAEMETIGTTHAHVGAYLLGLWGLPDSTVEAIAYHHSPGDCPIDGFAPLVAVHAANALLHAAMSDDGSAAGRMDAEFLQRTGHGHREATWRELVGETRNAKEAGV